MKLFVSGSPRTQTCYKIIKDIMTVNDAFFPLNELNIHYCRGCEKCTKEDIGKCIMEDDMTNVYNNINDFDTLVIVTPIYYDQITALTKMFIERLNPFLNSKKLYGKKVFVILTGALEKEENEEVISNIDMYFEDLCNIFQMKLQSVSYFNTDEFLKPFYIDKIMEIKNDIYKES